MEEQVVITGWGQRKQPKEAAPPFATPIDLMTEAARDAIAAAGDGIVPSLDAILVVRTQSRELTAPGEAIAHRLGIKPKLIRTSGIGGEVPQHFVNQAAGLLARGEARAVLICGAETYYPRAADAVRGEGALIQGIPSDYDADDAVGSNEYEQRHGLTLPIHGFPLFENALWGKSGLEREQWLARVGALWSGFSAVAAQHPNAWTTAAVSAERIITPAADNRPICFPYTKRMVSLVMADLGAAIIMTTAQNASTIRDGAGRAVYFRGGAFARDHQRFMVDKADFTYSPALAAVLAKAQHRAALGVDEIEGFDLYSCFPCAVNVARGQLGLGDDDPRPLTQTGGLGFFGGPGSNYALHGIATLAENIAAGKLRTGMATALGWFMHKYALGIYASTAGGSGRADADTTDLANPLAGDGPIPCTEQASGHGTIETYTVIYNRDQSPQRGLIYGSTDDGLRFVANCATDEATITELTQTNQVGRPVRLSHDRASGLNHAVLAD